MQTEKTVQLSALALKGEADRRKGKALRAFPPVSYEKAKTVVEKECKKGKRKLYEHFRRSLREGENGRKTRQESRDRKARRQWG